MGRPFRFTTAAILVLVATRARVKSRARELKPTAEPEPPAMPSARTAPGRWKFGHAEVFQLLLVLTGAAVTLSTIFISDLIHEPKPLLDGISYGLMAEGDGPGDMPKVVVMSLRNTGESPAYISTVRLRGKQAAYAVLNPNSDHVSIDAPFTIPSGESRLVAFTGVALENVYAEVEILDGSGHQIDTVPTEYDHTSATKGDIQPGLPSINYRSRFARACSDSIVDCGIKWNSWANGVPQE